MKNAIAFFLFLSTTTLFAQQSIESGELKMGTFTTGDTECYNFSVDDPGEFKLSYNLWDATMVVKDSTGQQLYTDYMAMFGESYKEHVINFNNKGKYQLCFTKGGAITSMYQIKVDKHSTAPNEPILLTYGDYHLKEDALDNSKMTYNFYGKRFDKIQIGISGALAGNVRISSPNGAELFNQSFDMPPENGITSIMDLQETGTYSIEITPALNMNQYTISIYLIHPVVTEEIVLSEEKGDIIVNSGIKYYEFYAYPNDTLQFTYTGYTESVAIEVKYPDGTTIPCSNVSDEIYIKQSLFIEQEGTYLLTINSGLQGYLTYSFILDLKPEYYELGTMIMRDMASLYKKTYKFKASESDLLRIGFNLPFGLMELRDPDNSKIMEIDSTAHTSIASTQFNEITLSKTGDYLLTVWHNSPNGSTETMALCASLVPASIPLTFDSLYKISVPPFQRIPMHFDTESGTVFRSGFPDGTIINRKYDGTIETRYGHTYLETKNRTNNVNLVNFSTETEQQEFSVMSVAPPHNTTQINVGDSLSTTINDFESPGYILSGLTGDTIFIVAEITESIPTPNENNIIAANSWLYLTTLSGETVQIPGNSIGAMSNEGYLIRYLIKKGYVINQDGDYFITLCLDKSLTESSAECKISINSSIQNQDIPFGIETPYELAGNYKCTVPEGLEQLIVVVKKNTHLRYSDTWEGMVQLEHNAQAIQQAVGKEIRQDDFIFFVNAPESGECNLSLLAKNFNSEINGSVLFTDKLPELSLNDWHTGVVLRPYGSDLKMLYLDHETDTLFLESEGYGLWSKIEVYNNDFELVETINNWGDGYHIKGFILNLQAGTYYIRYVDSAVLYDSSDDHFKTYKPDQSRTYMLYAGSSGSDEPINLQIRNVSSHKIGTGEASITLSGSGLNSVEQVILTNVADQSVIALDIYSADEQGNEMVVGNNFSNKKPGLYILRVSNSDTIVFYDSYIEVISKNNYSIKSTLITSNLYRTGRYQKCIIRVTNNGNVDIPFAAGMFYTTNEKVHIYHTEMYESFANPDTINSYLMNNPQNNLFLYIENLGVGKTFEFVYKIHSVNLTQNETFSVGVKMGILEASDYYSLQNEMAGKWYNYLLSREDLPDSTRIFLEDIKLDGYIDIWNGKNELEFRSLKTNTNPGRQKAGDGVSKFSNAATVTQGVIGGPKSIIGPFSIPQLIIEEGIDIIVEKGEEICKSLKDILDQMKRNQFGNESGITEEEMEKEAVSSTTPEDKYGPIGHGMAHGNGYISNLDEFEYRIDYWNKEDATAPAAIVYIRDTIDTDFDMTTLNFTELGFLKWKVKLDGGQYFDVNVDCRPDMPYIVNIKGTVDQETREVYWVHTTLDPSTMDIPDDPLSGYLPPIDSTGYQLGWVNFSIRPVDDLQHNTNFANQAFVNFDGVGKWGPAPPYGPYKNILDLNPPYSHVKALNAVQNDLSFDIHVHSIDEESGIDYMSIYVSKDGEKAQLWKTTQDSILSFTGEDGAHYRFYSLATDKVGNTEIKLSYDALTTVQLIETQIHQPIINFRNEMHIIPNPNHGVFRIETDVAAEKGTIEIISLSGQTIYLEEYTAGRNFYLKDVLNGIYIIRFYTKKRLLTGKLNLMK